MEIMKYYSVKKILGEKADYNIVIGERSNGKTYSLLSLMIQNFVNNGVESVYLRRWKEDITGKRAESIFNAIVSNGLVSKLTAQKYDNIVYYRGKYYLAKYDSTKKTMISMKQPFCHAMCLSDNEHDKSTSYPNVSLVVFDEFITRQYYLKDEFVLFMNVISTIIRERTDVKIFMLGNTVNKFCPYFAEMGLTKVDKQPQGTIEVYQYGESNLKVAVEYCGVTTAKKSNKYFAFSNPKLSMIKNGKWELGIYPHLSPNQRIKQSDIVFTFSVQFGNRIVSGDVVENDDGYFLFFHNRTTNVKDNELLYTLDYTTKPNVRKCFASKSDRIDLKIQNFFARQKVFYQSNDIGELIKNYLAECVHRGIV